MRWYQLEEVAKPSKKRRLKQIHTCMQWAKHTNLLAMGIWNRYSDCTEPSFGKLVEHEMSGMTIRTESFRRESIHHHPSSSSCCHHQLPYLSQLDEPSVLSTTPLDPIRNLWDMEDRARRQPGSSQHIHHNFWSYKPSSWIVYELHRVHLWLLHLSDFLQWLQDRGGSEDRFSWQVAL